MLGAEASSVDGCADEGGDEGGTWEDAAIADEADAVKADDDAMGLKPIDHDKWQQRQVCPSSLSGTGAARCRLSEASTSVTGVHWVSCCHAGRHDDKECTIKTCYIALT